ncbi:MAG: VWA domain-containing protein [Sandaracinaceae bacterium]
MKKKPYGRAARRRMNMAAGAVVLALGGIVLARAGTTEALPAPAGTTSPPTVETPTPTPDVAEPNARAAIETAELEGFVAFTQGAVLAHGDRELYAEARLEGRPGSGTARRRPVALAVALDVSGSMSGNKIVQARRALAELVAAMHPEDRVAVVTYNHEARVLVPLTEVRRVRAEIDGRVGELFAHGGTNIPQGLELAASRLAGAPPTHGRRLVLVSDGLDNSGQVVPHVVHRVAERAHGGVTTSALGVGIDYDESFLTGVADAGQGNYAFVARGAELATFLGQELEQASRTVAEGTALRFALPPGWRLEEVYGGEVETTPTGERQLFFGSLFEGERRRVTLRFTVPAGAPGVAGRLTPRLRYAAVRAATDRTVAVDALTLVAVPDPAQVDALRDVTLHAEAVAQAIDHRQAAAVEAWRDGRAEEARRISRRNVQALRQQQREAPAAAAALGGQLSDVEADIAGFAAPADSAAGRAHGLESNASRRSRARRY